MSKGFKKYLPVWAIFFVAINATAWIMPLIRSKMFWTAYGTVNCAFVVQLIISYFVLNQRKEVSVPVFVPSFISLIVLFIANAIGLYFFWKPWVLGVVSLVIISLTCLLMTIIGQNSEKMVARDEHVKEKTDTMLSLAKQAKKLYDNTGNQDIYRLYEALKYSNKAAKQHETDEMIKKEAERLTDIHLPEEVKAKVDHIISLINQRG